MTVTDHKGLTVLTFATRELWETWLARNGSQSPGVWLKLAKKGTGAISLAKSDALEAAIAHGWIDGQIDKFDAQFWLVRFTRRGPKSKWSQVNVATAERLVANQMMTPAGQAEIDRAKADGRWQAAYPSASKAEVPADLRMALEAAPEAKAFFAALTGTNRYAVLYRIHDAKTEKTRAARIVKFVAMLAEGRTIYPAPRKSPAAD